MYVFYHEDGNDEKAEAILREGLSHAQAALPRGSESFYVNKWNAICLGKIAGYEGTRSKVQSANQIKEFAQKASELDPTDPYMYHLLGDWCFQVASATWVEKRLARMFFGTAPESTFEEAEQYYLQAHHHKVWHENTVKLGDVCVAMQRLSRARHWYQATMDLPDTTDSEKRLYAEAADKLMKLRSQR